MCNDTFLSFSRVKVQYCRGTCKSGAFFKFGYPHFEQACDCCQATGYTMKTVSLLCPDGKRIIKPVKTVTSCKCQNCA